MRPKKQKLFCGARGGLNDRVQIEKLSILRAAGQAI